jgi:hypothetical protein
MDANRFDALSRALTTAGTRRTTLRALLGTLLGSALPLDSSEAAAETRLVATDEVTAACGPAKKRCKHSRQCCTGKCLKSGPGQRGKCSCNASNPCPQPSDPCKKSVCTSTGRCAGRRLC